MVTAALEAAETSTEHINIALAPSGEAVCEVTEELPEGTTMGEGERRV